MHIMMTRIATYLPLPASSCPLPPSIPLPFTVSPLPHPLPPLPLLLTHFFLCLSITATSSLSSFPLFPSFVILFFFYSSPTFSFSCSFLVYCSFISLLPVLCCFVEVFFPSSSSVLCHCYCLFLFYFFLLLLLSLFISLSPPPVFVYVISLLSFFSSLLLLLFLFFPSFVAFIIVIYSLLRLLLRLLLLTSRSFPHSNQSVFCVSYPSTGDREEAIKVLTTRRGRRNGTKRRRKGRDREGEREREEVMRSKWITLHLPHFIGS